MDDELNKIEDTYRNAGLNSAVEAAKNISDFVEPGDEIGEYVKRLKAIDKKAFNEIIKEMYQEVNGAKSGANYYVKY